MKQGIPIIGYSIDIALEYDPTCSGMNKRDLRCYHNTTLLHGNSCTTANHWTHFLIWMSLSKLHLIVTMRKSPVPLLWLTGCVCVKSYVIHVFTMQAHYTNPMLLGQRPHVNSITHQNFNTDLEELKGDPKGHQKRQEEAG